MIDLLHAHAQLGMLRFAGGLNLLLHTGGQINRNRERYALIAARAGVDLAVDAHYLALRIEQRPARIAGVDCHIGLQERHE